MLKDILAEKRADYGEQVVRVLSARLEGEFGRGFGEKNLRRMVQFAEVYPDREIVAALLRQLSWTHFTMLIPLDDPLKRDFYAEMCRIERWSTRTLRKKIDSMLFERTALSRKPAKLAEQELRRLRDEDKLSPDLVFRDPYLLDFLGLKDTYAEKDLEAAILREMEAFILELGVGFAFLERQKRITVDGVDYYLDLLERKLHDAVRLARARLESLKKEEGATMRPEFRIFISFVQRELAEERRAMRDFLQGDPKRRTGDMDGSSNLFGNHCPEGAKHISPGQGHASVASVAAALGRDSNGFPRPERATQVARAGRSLFRPYRASDGIPRLPRAALRPPAADSALPWADLLRPLRGEEEHSTDQVFQPDV